MLKDYYWLTKPGIIYGNLLTTTAGFFLGYESPIHWWAFFATLLGISFIIGSACVFNNIMDRDIDVRMERTKHRAMVIGVISKRHAFIFATILLILGSIALNYHANTLTFIIGLIGFIVYVAIYSPLKRRTVHATLIGAIAGATPPVAGYTAASGKFDLGAILFFLILVAWQMPHFYAIAIRRIEEYKAASIPVLPIAKGILATKIHMVIYIVIFIVVSSLLYFYRYTEITYLIIVGLLGLAWLMIGLQGFKKSIDDKAWAKKTFLFSLIVLTMLSLTISIEAIIKKGV